MPIGDDDLEREERRRKADERRRKILAGAQTRLDRIQGRPTDTREPVEDATLPSASPRVTPAVERTREVAPVANVVEEKFLSEEAPKEKSAGRRVATERAVATMHATQRGRILVAAGLALAETALNAQKVSPVTLLLLSELTLIAASWMYFQLYPLAQVEQIRTMRSEKKFREGSGMEWRLSFLRALPGVASWLDFLYDLRFCFQTLYADIAVFIVLVIVIRSLYTDSATTNMGEL